MRRLALAFAISLAWISAAAAQPAPLPPGEKEPFLRLEAGGPTSFVTSLAFSPDGRLLYAAGWDKVVRVWKLDGQGRFVLEPRSAYRVPIGPGLAGAINAMTLSPDGAWLALAGRGHVRQEAGFRQPGLIVPGSGAMSDEMRQDQGLIYLFNTRTREVKLLRGHGGPVLTLEFAPPQAGKPTVLLSAAHDWDSAKQLRTGSVRAWDVDKAESLGELHFPEPQRRPALAAWHTGAEAKQLRVALAWGEEQAWLWSVATGEKQQMADGRYNNTTLYLPDRKTLVTGSSGVVKLWDVADPTKAPRELKKLDLTGRGIPRAVSAFSAASRGAVDRAVFVASLVGPANQPIENRLYLVDLVNLKVLSDRGALWQGANTLPVIAASQQHVAVAGSPEHDIRIFPLAELLKPNPVPQRVRSVGETFRYVGFVKKGAAVGLLLSDKPGAAGRAPAAGDLVFEVATRKLSPVAGWSTWTPNTTGWKATAGVDAATKAPLVTISGPNSPEKRILLAAREQLSDVAILPPVAGRTAPIVAVALHDLGQPSLRLYHAGTGEQLREYTEHTERLGRLAFSGDGRLLASVAEDQTVRVWSLTDLDQILGRRGMLNGVGVKQAEAGVAVERLPAEGPLAKELAVGDIIQGLVIGGKFDDTPTAQEYFRAMSLQKPRDNVTLRVARAGQARDVALPVAQGIDERKPILSLFFTRPDAAGVREWVGWTPLGPYEASSRAAERLIGWHFNTGRPDLPASFALADQYRDTYYRAGVIADIIAAGGYKPAAAAAPLARPSLAFWLSEPGQPSEVVDPARAVRLRNPQSQLSFSIDPLRPDQVASVAWQVGEGPSQAISRSAADVWTADLAPQAWARGETPVLVTLRTREPAPQSFVYELRMHFAPPAPAVEAVAPPAVVNQAQLAVKGAVKGDAAQAVVALRLGDGASQPVELGADGAFQANLELQPGLNRVTLVAQRKDAVPADGDLTRTEQAWLVTYNPQPMAPPQITVSKITASKITALGAGKAQPDAADVMAPVSLAAIAHVRHPRVRIEGQIEGAEPLSVATFQTGAVGAKPADAQNLAGFTGKSKTLAFAQEVTLAPGEHVIALAAQTAGSVRVELPLRVFYRPELPTADIVSPPAGSSVDAGDGAQMADLTVRFSRQDRFEPFRVRTLVNGKPVGEVRDQREHVDQLDLDVPLTPGDNQIEVLLDNPWGATRRTDPLVVKFFRTPRVKLHPVEPAVSDVGQEPGMLVDVPVEIETPPELPPALIALNEFEIPLDSLQSRGQVKGGWRKWIGIVRNIPLESGENLLRLTATNADGATRRPAEVKAVGRTLTIPRPEIDLISPMRSLAVSQGSQEIRFRVRSLEALRRVELVAGGKTIYRAADLDKLPKNAAGQFILEHTQPVQLERGPNEFYLRAVSAGGIEVIPLVLSLVQHPVRIVVDGLAPMTQPDAAVPPEQQTEHQLAYLKPVPEGRLWLTGRVLWAGTEDARIDQPIGVRTWVNGFQQVGPELPARQGDSLERKFKVPVVLSRDKKNRVELELTGLEQEASDRSQFFVDCDQPDARQRLHLLVVGAAEGQDSDVAPLAGDVLKAVQAQQQATGGFKTPAFASGRLYGPLTGYVSPGQVITQLLRIKTTLKIRAAHEFSNDVVMVYYHGREAVDEAGQSYLLTSASQHDADLQRSAISSSQLEGLLGKAPGAHLVLLDVEHGAKATSLAGGGSAWPLESRIGMIRSSWLATNAAPTESRLFSSLASAMSASQNLLDVKARMSTQFATLGKKYPQAIEYALYVPSPLEDLVISRP